MNDHDHPARHERPAVLDVVEENAAAMCRSEQRVCWTLARGVDPAMEPAAYSVLSAIRMLGDSRVTDLASTLGMSKPAVSGHVAALELLGLVERGEASDDERSYPVALTAEGLRRIDHARGGRRRRFRRQLEGWEQADVVELVRLLARFNTAYLAADVPETPILPQATPGRAGGVTPLPASSSGARSRPWS